MSQATFRQSRFPSSQLNNHECRPQGGGDPSCPSTPCLDDFRATLAPKPSLHDSGHVGSLRAAREQDDCAFSDCNLLTNHLLCEHSLLDRRLRRHVHASSAGGAVLTNFATWGARKKGSVLIVHVRLQHLGKQPSLVMLPNSSFRRGLLRSAIIATGNITCC